MQYCLSSGSTGDTAAPNQYVQEEKGVISFIITIVKGKWGRVCATISVGTGDNYKWANSGPVIVSDAE